MTTSTSHRDQATSPSPRLWGAVLLFFASAALLLAERALPDFSIKAGFSQYPPQRVFDHLWFFPLSAGILTVVSSVFSLSDRGRAVLYATFFALAIAPSLDRAAALLGFAACFWILSVSFAGSTAHTILLSLITLLCMATPFWHPALLSGDPWVEYTLQMWGTLLLGYVLHVRYYNKQDARLTADYWEFLLCPVLYFLPAMLNVLLFGYFLQKKNSRRFEFWKTTYTFFTAIACLFLLSLGWNHLEQRHTIYNIRAGLPGVSNTSDRILSAYLYGIVFHALTILHHTGSIYFSVSVARCMGYGLRFDTKFPILSRSPMEYWRRMHNYFMDYVYRTAVIPGMTYFGRWGVRWKTSLFASVTIFFFAASALHINSPRPLQAPRTAAGTAAIVGLVLAVVYMHLYFSTGKGRGLAQILSPKPKPVLSWRLSDFLLWGATNFFLYPAVRFLAIFLR